MADQPNPFISALNEEEEEDPSHVDYSIIPTDNVAEGVWYKVLIHETFHTFGLDFDQESASDCMKQTYRGIHPSTHDLRINEAYTETWAEIIHLVLDTATDKARFLHCLEYEKAWSILQCIHILQRSGMTYDQLVSGHGGNKYRETKTQVFSYYLLKSIFMIHIQDFISWCMKSTGKNNYSCMAFQDTLSNQASLCVWINSICHDNVTQQWFRRVQKRKRMKKMQKMITLRMTSPTHHRNTAKKRKWK